MQKGQGGGARNLVNILREPIPHCGDLLVGELNSGWSTLPGIQTVTLATTTDKFLMLLDQVHHHGNFLKV